MGIVENIKESVKDIVGGGISKRFQRKKKEGESEFESKRVTTEVGLREKTTTGESVPGTRRTISSGGGSRTQDFSETAKAAQIAQLAEVARQAAAIKTAREKADRQREEIRQERIEAGTVGGQFETDVGMMDQGLRTADPGTIDVFRRDDFSPEKRFRREGTGVKSFFQETGRDIGILARGIFLGRDIKDLRDPFNVFEDVGKQEGEKVAFTTPQFGTEQVDPVTGKIVTGEKTLFELQAEAQREAGVPEEVIGRSPEAQAAFIGTQIGGEISRGLIEQGQQEIQQSFDIIQGKVDTGELSVKRGTEALGRIQESLSTKLEGEFGVAFGEEFKQRTSLLQQLGGDLTERTGAKAGRVAKEVAIIGGLTVASLALSPVTFAAASVLGGTIAEAKGAERTRDILFGAGLIGGIQAPGAIARSIDVGRLAELEALTFQQRGVSIIGRSGKEARTLLGGTRDTGFASQTLDLFIPTLKTGKGVRKGVETFTIGGGKGTTTTRLTSFELQIGGAVGEEAIITTTAPLSFSGRGLTGLQSFTRATGRGGAQLRTPTGENILGSLGKLDLVIDEKVLRTSFGGTSETIGRIVKGAGGRAEKAFLTFGETGKISTKGILVAPRTTSEVVVLSEKDLLGSVLKAGKGFGAPSELTGLGPSQQILKQLGGGLGTTPVSISGQKLTGAGVQAGATITELVPASIKLGAPIGVSPAVGGLSLISKRGTEQLTISRDAITPTTFSISAPSLKDMQSSVSTLGLITVKKPRTGKRAKVSTAFDFISATDVIQESAFESVFGTVKARPSITKPAPITPSPFFDIGVPRVPIPPIGGPGVVPFSLPPIVSPLFPSGKRKGKRKPRIRQAIAPSLTGLAVFDIGGITGDPLELSGRGGRSPFDIRFVPEDLAGKREPGLGLGIFIQPIKKKMKK